MGWKIFFIVATFFGAGMTASATPSEAPGTFTIKMATFTGASIGGELGDDVPFRYTVARGWVPESKRFVKMKQHNQSQYVTFNERDYVDQTSYIGAYVPKGYVARYRTAVTQKKYGECTDPKQSDFDSYKLYGSIFKIDRNDREPLRLEVGQLTYTTCLYVHWLLQKQSNDLYFEVFGGSIADLYEDPVVRPNGPQYMPETQSLEVQSDLSDGGGFRLGVSEDFGGVAKTLEIFTDSGNRVSILKNGAPTDDGLVWGIPIYGATGLYAASTDSPTQAGASQFVGHTDHGSGFSANMWGFRHPLEKKGGSHYQYLQMPDDLNHQGEKMFLPMYTDFSYSHELDDSLQTLPFMLPKSPHTFDGRIERIAAGQLKDVNGQFNGLARLMYHFKFRAHQIFTAQGGYKPHFWFNQRLANRINLKIVRWDDSVGTIDYQTLMNPAGLKYLSTNRYETPTQNQIEQADEVWRNFCGDGRSQAYGYCKMVGPDLKCHCANLNKFKRVIYEYPDHNVAISVQGMRPTMPHMYVGVTYLTQIGYNPGLLISFSNHDKTNRSGELRLPMDPNHVEDDYYFFTIGTMDRLNINGLGVE